MNLTETAQLLTYVAAVDNRRPDEATVLAWHDIVGDLMLDEAKAAVTRHFRYHPNTYLMPGHVREGVLELRERHRVPSEARMLPSRFEPTTPERIAQVKEGIARCAAALTLTLERRSAQRADGAVMTKSDEIRERAIARARMERKGVSHV